MRLEVGDREIDNPSPDDVARAVPNGAPPEDWSLEVSRDDDVSMDAYADEGAYAVTLYEKDKIFDAAAPMRGDALRALLLDFARDAPGWRARAAWKEYTLPAKSSGGTGRFTALLPLLAAVPALVIFASIAGYSPLALLPDLSWPFPPPFDSIVARMVIIFIGLFMLLILVATIVKFAEVRRASRWPKASGRIVRSETKVETRQESSGVPTHRTVPDIAYEFSAGGKTYQGSRVTLAEIVSDDELPGMLARYPRGKIVEVFYDPRDPKMSVLERDMPAGVSLGLFALFAILIGFAGVAIWLASSGPAAVKAWLPNSNPYVLLPAAVITLLLFAMFAQYRNRVAAAQAWPTTQGEVMLSDIRRGAKRSYAPLVEYAYSVGGRAYRSRQIRLGSETAGSEGYARKRAGRYPRGAKVSVRYNPKNPNEAALEARVGLAWIIAILGAVAALVAIGASGLI